MHTDQILMSIAAVVFLATLCQVVARRIGMPALLLLLPAGFGLGALVPVVDPMNNFGDAFSLFVGLAVALILFHGGMELYQQPIERADVNLVRRLVFLGGLLTLLAVGGLAWLLFDVPPEIAFLLGAILIVSGPTVVTPLLEFIRPDPRVARILKWEGVLVDPFGALTAVILFQGVQASDASDLPAGATLFAASVLVGLLGAVVGSLLIGLGMRLAGGSRVLGTQVLFGSVIAVAAFCNAVADDSGLLAAVVMGMVVPRYVPQARERDKPFFDTLVSIAIGLLFVSISATVTPDSLQGLVLPAIVLVALLVLVVRPLVGYLCTAGGGLASQQRAFIGWMAPRGIVAASTASGFGAALSDTPGGEVLLPVTFMVVAGTVAIYGLTAAPMASWLGVRRPPDQ